MATVSIFTRPLAPTIISDGGGPTATVTVAVDDLSVTIVRAYGSNPLVYSIDGGADAGLFTIDSASGALTFVGSEPAANYVVIVKAANGSSSDTQTITVMVSDYTGPLDIVPGAVVAYGQRALSAAMRGTAVYTIKRDSDDTTQSFSSDATTGAADSAAIVAFIGGGAGTVTLWNDQSGADRDAIGSGVPPTWLAAQLGAVPALVDGGFGSLSGSDMSFPNGGATVFAVMQKTCGTGLSGGAGPYVNADFATDNCGGDMYVDPNDAGGRALTVNLDVWCIVEMAWEFGSKVLLVNGISQSFDQSYDSGGALGPAVVSSANSGIAFSGGQDRGAAEILVYPSVLSSGNRVAIRQNIAAYYGITLV